MKVVAFNGSPHQHGNTAQMVDAFFVPLRAKGFDCEMVQVGGVMLHGCYGCHACQKLSHCVFDDDPSMAGWKR